jgi:hypothetical protein
MRTLNPMVDLPPEIWFHIISFLPRSCVRKLIGVNRTLFEIALDEIYREVRLISDDGDTVNTFKQLRYYLLPLCGSFIG